MDSGACVLSDILNFVVSVCGVVEVCRWSCLTMGGDCPGVMGGYENGDWLELWQVQLISLLDSIFTCCFLSQIWPFFKFFGYLGYIRALCQSVFERTCHC